MTVTRSLHQKLAASLKVLRRNASISADELGKRLDWSQSKVSKIENGRTMPSARDVEALLRVLDAPDELRTELLDLAKAIHADSILWDRNLPGGLAGHQHKIADLEARATEIRLFNCDIVPGLLQTADYARRVLTLGDLDKKGNAANAVVARMERQTILYEETRNFYFLITEGALKWKFGPKSLMHAQYDRVRSIATLPNVFIGVLPFSCEVTTLYPEAFVLYSLVNNETSVRVETHTREWTMSEPDEVHLYLDVFEQMWKEAVKGQQATQLLESLQ